MKKKLVYIVLGVLVIGLAFGLNQVTQLTNNQDIRQRASTQTGVATLTLVPQSQTINPGQIIPISVQLDTKGKTIGVASFRITYPFIGTVPQLDVTDSSGNQIGSLTPDGGLNPSDWSFPVKSITRQNGTVTIDFSGVMLNAGGYASTGAINLVTFYLKANTTNPTPVTLAFDPSHTIVLQKSDNTDVLLPPSNGVYQLQNSPTPTFTPTPTLKPSNTPTSKPSSTSTPTLSPVSTTPTLRPPTNTPTIGISTPTPTSTQTYTIQGTHVDTNGSPFSLQGQRVTIQKVGQSNGKSTSSTPSWSFTNLTAGTYTVTAAPVTGFSIRNNACSGCTFHPNFTDGNSVTVQTQPTGLPFIDVAFQYYHTQTVFSFSFKLQGISKGGVVKKVQVDAVPVNNTDLTNVIYTNAAVQVTSDANGVFHPSGLDVIFHDAKPGEQYKVYIKEDNYLRKYMGNVTIQADRTNAPADWDNIVLKAGDFTHQNNITIFSLGAFLQAYTQLQTPVTSQTQGLDVDNDGFLTITDVGYALQNYTALENPGDQD